MWVILPFLNNGFAITPHAVPNTYCVYKTKSVGYSTELTVEGA